MSGAADRGKEVSLRRRLWEVVEVARPGDRASRIFDSAILGLIVLNVVAVIVESMGSMQARYGAFFSRFEVFSVAVFTVEYAIRVVACVEDGRFRGPVLGRLRFMLTPLALVDLVAILPFYLAFMEVDLIFVRALRLFRILRIAKIGRYLSAFSLFGRVLRSRKEELVLTTGLMFVLLLVDSCLMYFAETEAQPEQFPDIPAAMWWAVATLTTVGYGVVYPVTGIGRLLGAVVAILGICLFALPTGILGSGFVEEIQARRELPVCPHCGKSLSGEGGDPLEPATEAVYDE